MAYHSKNGTEFVGLRLIKNGRRQVVYDASTGARILLEIKDPAANLNEIHDALREGVNARNVLTGVLTALWARNIKFDYPA